MIITFRDESEDEAPGRTENPPEAETNGDDQRHSLYRPPWQSDAGAGTPDFYSNIFERI
jgi:hypothetical protein